MATTMRHWLGTKKYQMGQAVRALAYRTPTPWGQRVVANFWEEQAIVIHQQWGEDTHDFAVLSALFQQYGSHDAPLSILDVGCGSGRLFGLYQTNGINDIVGLDISEKALALANERYPTVPTIQGKVEDLDFPAERFSLAICNRVLQHIPPNLIAAATGKLATICRMVYVNELSDSDQLREEFFMFRHDYPTLFAEHGLQLIASGTLGKQTYSLYGSQ
jgi:SAM-dependent methyltransferase